jgi:hypothetical protein
MRVSGRNSVGHEGIAVVFSARNAPFLWEHKKDLFNTESPEIPAAWLSLGSIRAELSGLQPHEKGKDVTHALFFHKNRRSALTIRRRNALTKQNIFDYKYVRNSL